MLSIARSISATVAALPSAAQARAPQDGRNYNTFTVVLGVFDRNGDYAQGIATSIEFRLKDDRLGNRTGQGSPFGQL